MTFSSVWANSQNVTTARTTPSSQASLAADVDGVSSGAPLCGLRDHGYAGERGFEPGADSRDERFDTGLQRRADDWREARVVVGGQLGRAGPPRWHADSVAGSVPPTVQNTDGTCHSRSERTEVFARREGRYLFHAVCPEVRSERRAHAFGRDRVVRDEVVAVERGDLRWAGAPEAAASPCTIR